MVKLKRIYKSQQFHINFISYFFNPFYFTRNGIFKCLKRLAPELSGDLLDFGCGRKPYKELFKVNKYIGLDIESSGHNHNDSEIDIFYDGRSIPFENNSFDSVFSSEVFEHIFNLDDVLNEIQRVLKPGGRLLITVPFVWDEHEIPYDFGRYSSYGITHLLEKNGFYVVKHIKSSTYIETIGQLIINYIYQNLFPKSTFIKIILTPLIITPLIFLIKILNIILPDNTNFYLTNIVLAIKK